MQHPALNLPLMQSLSLENHQQEPIWVRKRMLRIIHSPKGAKLGANPLVLRSQSQNHPISKGFVQTGCTGAVAETC